MISLGALQKTRYWPEKIPVGTTLTIPAGGVSPAPLDLRRFDGWLFALTDLALPRDSDLRLRVYEDDDLHQYRLGAIADRVPMPWWFLGRTRLGFDLVNSGTVPKSNLAVRFSVWAWHPTVADRLALGMALSEEEQRLARSLGLGDSVEKGVLPLPFDAHAGVGGGTLVGYQIQREYHVLRDEWIPEVVSIAPGQPYTLMARNPAKGTALVLRAVAMSPQAATTNLRAVVDRDGDLEYVTVPSHVMTSPDDEVSMFIPAVAELRVTLRADAPVTGALVRVRVQTIRLTNTLRARWGLVPTEQLPGDVAEKVRGGVL